MNTKFQWIYGEFIGAIETLLNYKTESGVNYAIFQSGRRLPVEDMSTHLAKIDEHADEEIIDSNKLKNEFFKESYTSANKLSHEEMVFGKKIINQDNKPQIEFKKNSNSITIQELLSKQLDKNPVIIDFNIKLPTIKYEYYNMLSEMHNSIKKELIDIIMEKHINYESIRTQVEENLSNYYGDNVIKSDFITLNAEEI